MIALRFRMQCKPERAEQVAELLSQVVPPSRAISGVISFDIGRDLVDPNVFIATEVFEDLAALDLQEELPEVGLAMSVLEGALAAEPEATLYVISRTEPYGD